MARTETGSATSLEVRTCRRCSSWPVTLINGERKLPDGAEDRLQRVQEIAGWKAARDHRRLHTRESERLPEFTSAFGCKADDPMVRAADKRCEVW